MLKMTFLILKFIKIAFIAMQAFDTDKFNHTKLYANYLKNYQTL